MKYKINHFFLILPFIFAVLFFPTNVSASSIIFQDDFNDGVLDGWTVARNMQFLNTQLPCKDGGENSSWKIINGRINFRIDGTPCISEIVPDTWNGSLNEYTIDLDMEMGEGTDFNLAFRYSNPSSWYDIKIFKQGTVFYQLVPASGPLISGNFQQLSPHVHHIRIEILNGSIKTWIDNVSTLDAQYDPLSEPSPLGKLALQASAGANSFSEVFFDNIVVTSIGDDPTPSPSPTTTPSPTPTPTPTPSPTPSPSPSPVPTPKPFPYYSQRDPKWKNDIYDKARSWSPQNPTFERWGCGVTAASMILNFHGISHLPNGKTSTPGNLNSWLKAQADGYVRNGQVNWNAISRATKLVSLTNSFLPRLEYRYLGNSLSELESNLTNNRPVIVEEPGHFISAFQFNSPTDIDIADPFYTERTKLAAYGNTFTSLRLFTPSFTDLSYILAHADMGSTLTLEKKVNGVFEPVVGVVEYIQQPLIDDISTNSASLQPFTVLEYPKPDDGEYRILVQKDGGVGNVEIYTYDDNGKPTKESFETLFGTTPTEFSFTIGTKKSHITQKMGFDELQGLLLEAKEIGAFKFGYDGNDLVFQLEASEALYPTRRRLSKTAFFLFERILLRRRRLIDHNVFSILQDSSDLLEDQVF